MNKEEEVNRGSLPLWKRTTINFHPSGAELPRTVSSVGSLLSASESHQFCLVQVVDQLGCGKVQLSVVVRGMEAGMKLVDDGGDVTWGE